MIDPDFDARANHVHLRKRRERQARSRSILTTFGWETEDIGCVHAARAIEPLAMPWCIPGLREQQMGHGFKVLTKQGKPLFVPGPKGDAHDLHVDLNCP